MSATGEISPVAEPAEQRVVERVPYEEDDLPDPEGQLVDVVDGEEDLDVVEEEEVVEDGDVERHGAVVETESGPSVAPHLPVSLHFFVKQDQRNAITNIVQTLSFCM